MLFVFLFTCFDFFFNALNIGQGSFYGIGKSTLSLKQIHPSRNVKSHLEA